MINNAGAAWQLKKKKRACGERVNLTVMEIIGMNKEILLQSNESIEKESGLLRQSQ